MDLDTSERLGGVRSIAQRRTDHRGGILTRYTVLCVRGKPNARLLLPSELIVARDGSSEDIVKYVVDVIESYDSGTRSYSELSMRIKEKAQTKLMRFNTTALTQMFSACCDSRR